MTDNTERDELVDIAKSVLAMSNLLVAAQHPDQIADAILAAGYRKPRTIPDAHLACDKDGIYPEDFADGLIVESADGTIWRYEHEDGGWDSLGWGSASLRGPATVLYEPTP